MLIETANQDEWLAERMKGIGASEAPIVMGVSRYKSRDQLWAEKVSGVVPPQLSNNAIDLGHLLEIPLLDFYSKQTGHQVVHEGQVIYASDQFDFIRASPDGRGVSYGAPGIIEVKTTTQNWTSLPYHVWIQVQQQLFVREEEWADVIALTQNRPRIWSVSRDETFIAKLVQEEISFWESVQERTRPEPISIVQEAGDGVELPKPMTGVIAELVQVKERIKDHRHTRGTCVVHSSPTSSRSRRSARTQRWPAIRNLSSASGQC